MASEKGRYSSTQKSKKELRTRADSKEETQQLPSTSRRFKDALIDHSRLVNEKVYSDIGFVVDSKTIRAHKAIVQARCPNMFKKAVKKVSSKKNLTIYEIDEKSKITEDALNRVLVYLYSGQVDFASLQLIQCVHLIHAGCVYELERLVQMCERYLQEHFTLDNIYDLLKESHELGVERAKRLCLYYALDHHDQFVAGPRAKELGIELFQEVAIKHASPETKQEVINNREPRPVTEKDTIIDDFKALYESGDNTDVVFQIEGKQIKCIRALLANRSSALESLWNGDKGTPKKPAVLDEERYKNFSAEAFNAMLKYIYYGEENIDPLPATELIGFCKEFGLPDLLNVCEEIIRKGIATNTVLAILAVAYTMPEKPDLQKELKTNCLEFIVRNLPKIVLEPLYKMAPQIGADILVAIQKEIGHRWVIVDSDRKSTQGDLAAGSGRGKSFSSRKLADADESFSGSSQKKLETVPEGKENPPSKKEEHADERKDKIPATGEKVVAKSDDKSKPTTEAKEEPKKEEQKKDEAKQEPKEEPKKEPKKDEPKKDLKKEKRPESKEFKEETKKADTKPHDLKEEELKKSEPKHQEPKKEEPKKEEPKKVDTKRHESKEELKKVDVKSDTKEEPKKIETKPHEMKEEARKEESKKVDTKPHEVKEEPKKEEPKKEETKKIETKAHEVKEEAKKEDVKKVDMKPHDTKGEPKKEETKKIETKAHEMKEEAKKEELKKEETKKIETKPHEMKEETKKEEPKKDETKKIETKAHEVKEEPKKEEPKKVDTKPHEVKEEPKKEEQKKVDTQSHEMKEEAKKEEPKKVDKKSQDTKKEEPKKDEPKKEERKTKDKKERKDKDKDKDKKSKEK
jgi:hypothetical protein